MGEITKAVIPVAGLGTRLLPATKSIPKEMLPVVDKPAIQYVVEEAVRSGLQHVLMVTGRNKAVLENHFDRAVEIEASLLESGDEEKLNAVEQATNLADIHYVRQGNPLGLGHAILKAESFVGTEAFSVLLGDDLIQETSQLLFEMMGIATKYKVSVIALMPVPEADICKFGIAEAGEEIQPGLYKLSGLVEKPNPEVAPSNLAIVGRYVLQNGVFEHLKKIHIGLNEELQLTDALNSMATSNEAENQVFGLIYSGERFDVGNRIGYLKANIQLALGRNDLNPEFSDWLVNFSRGLSDD